MAKVRNLGLLDSTYSEREPAPLSLLLKRASSVVDVSRGSRAFYCLLAIGLVVRLILIPCAATTDLLTYTAVADQGSLNHSLYEAYTNSYPPLFGYWFLVVGKLLACVHYPTAVVVPALQPYSVRTLTSNVLPTPWAMFLIKLPQLALDIACTRMIFLLAPRGLARPSALMWWLNPLVIFASAISANWDVVVPFSILLMLQALRQGSPFSAGVWIGLGVAAKIVPLFELPLAVAFLLRGGVRRGVSQITQLVIGMSIVALVMALPIMLWGDYARLIDSITARASGFYFGGLTVWSWTQVTQLAAIVTELRDHVGYIQRSFEAVQLIAAALMLRAALAPTISTSRLFVLALIPITALLVISPLVQPAYVIWVLPMLILLHARRRRFALPLVYALSAIAFAFILSVRAPQALMLPGCHFFHMCNETQYSKIETQYGWLPGHFTALLQTDIDMVLGTVGGLLILVLFVSLLRQAVKPNAIAQ